MVDVKQNEYKDEDVEPQFVKHIVTPQDQGTRQSDIVSDQDHESLLTDYIRVNSMEGKILKNINSSSSLANQDEIMPQIILPNLNARQVKDDPSTMIPS